ncbi:MAG: hypothetical protein AAGU11_11355 [Syntrophobacteraceae bacterium]
MRLFSAVLLGLLIAGFSLFPALSQPVHAQFIHPEEFLEDNPARFNEAREEGKRIVPDISALGPARAR